eukprot:5751921-Prymnesium_polylepis.1
MSSISTVARDTASKVGEQRGATFSPMSLTRGSSARSGDVGGGARWAASSEQPKLLGGAHRRSWKPDTRGRPRVSARSAYGR